MKITAEQTKEYLEKGYIAFDNQPESNIQYDIVLFDGTPVINCLEKKGWWYPLLEDPMMKRKQIKTEDIVLYKKSDKSYKEILHERIQAQEQVKLDIETARDKKISFLKTEINQMFKSEEMDKVIASLPEPFIRPVKKPRYMHSEKLSIIAIAMLAGHVPNPFLDLPMFQEEMLSKFYQRDFHTCGLPGCEEKVYRTNWRCCTFEHEKQLRKIKQQEAEKK